ncbi:MAG: protein phosphatase [Legionella sp.]|nr:protein phosphatase [Legionella sp.]
MTPETIISKPTPGESSGERLEYGFGFFKTQNERLTEEDALAWHLIDKLALKKLSPEEIGKRLWTTYQILDQNVASLKGGTTASTTVFDGENLITATIGDSAIFGVAYRDDGSVIGVIRLNKQIHKPSQKEEIARIVKTGSKIDEGLVEGVFAVSRAIGDYGVQGIRGTVINKAALAADAHIDIININTDLQILPEVPGKLQIIATCDGFTDGAGPHQQTKKGHEDYLRSCLQSYLGNTAGKASEKNIARYLADKAVASITQHRKVDPRLFSQIDNIAVAVQTLGDNAVVLGAYDGHNGSVVAEYVADNVGRVFLEQCALAPEQYEEQEFSVTNNLEAYMRDNCEQDNSPKQPHHPVGRRPRSISFLSKDSFQSRRKRSGFNEEPPGANYRA